MRLLYIASKLVLTMKLHDKVALVTGSARGIGWEMIQAFAQEGAKVAICDLSQSDVDGAIARLGLPPETVLGVEADVGEDLLVAVRRRGIGGDVVAGPDQVSAQFVVLGGLVLDHVDR